MTARERREFEVAMAGDLVMRGRSRELGRRGFLAAVSVLVGACRAHEPSPEERIDTPSERSASPVPTPVPSVSASASAQPAASSADVPPPRREVDLVERRFAANEGGPQKVMVGFPAWGKPGEVFPLLIALHGRGEAQKGMEAGALGWWNDYSLARAFQRLLNPPLVSADFESFVTTERLASLNASLVARPFRGVIVATPFTPDLLAEKTLNNAGPFGAFVVEHLLPSLRADARVDSKRAATGIDGVSLGGRVSLLVGFAHAEQFGAVGSLQAAIQASEATELSRRAKKAGEAAPQKLRLVTSERDFYKDEIRLFDRALTHDGVEHEHIVLKGPHDYPWNRGPGAIEMLLWHDRVLRGERGI